MQEQQIGSRLLCVQQLIWNGPNIRGVPRARATKNSHLVENLKSPQCPARKLRKALFPRSWNSSFGGTRVTPVLLKWNNRGGKWWSVEVPTSSVATPWSSSVVGTDLTFLCFSSGALGNLWVLCVHHVWALASNFEQLIAWGPHSSRLMGGTRVLNLDVPPVVQPCVFVALPDWVPHPGNHSAWGLWRRIYFSLRARGFDWEHYRQRDVSHFDWL